jgi:hypothetical protein
MTSETSSPGCEGHGLAGKWDRSRCPSVGGSAAGRSAAARPTPRRLALSLGSQPGDGGEVANPVPPSLG